MERRTSMLDIFPIELLFLVKDHIPDNDLRTDVCFCQVLGQASEKVYNDIYWENACVSFGLTTLAGEDASKTSWRDFVFDIIRRDGFCDHPQCGVRRLEQNFREMSKIYMKDHTRGSLMQVLNRQSPNTYRGFVATNTLFANLDFGRESHARTAADGFLQTRGAHRNQRSLLFDHPIVCRSFASFAPTGSAELVTFSGIPPVMNPSGVTVWDVFSAVQAILDATSSVYRMNEYLRFVDYRKALSNRVDDFTYLLKQLTTLRDFFHIFRWNGLFYAGQDCNNIPCFAFGFKTVRRVLKGVSEPQLIV